MLDSEAVLSHRPHNSINDPTLVMFTVDMLYIVTHEHDDVFTIGNTNDHIDTETTVVGAVETFVPDCSPGYGYCVVVACICAVCVVRLH